MSKNKGGKGKRKGKKHVDDSKRELEFKDEDQEYAQVTKMLGEGRLEATCTNNSTRICHIRGKFRKRVWINVGDIILIGLREFQDGKGDVIHKYTPEEARTLKAYGELPQSMVIGGDGAAGADDEANADKDAVGFYGSESDSEEEGKTIAKEEEDASDMKNVDWNKALEEL
jgi:translation initiation factor 1A